MADRVGTVLVHPRLGVLRWYRDEELVGSIDIDPAVRPPRANRDRDVEVLLEVAPTMTGAGLGEHIDRCASRIDGALARLESIKQFAVEHAPAGWVAQYAPQSGTLTDLLFLDGVEADTKGELSLVFDFGDLDQLVIRLDGVGAEAAVCLRP